MKTLQSVNPIILLLIATTLEVCGDAVIRIAIYKHSGSFRVGLFLLGAVLLFGYGAFLNISPIQFGRVVGLYIATLFIVWQVVNTIAFGTLPTMSILVGGTMIVAGGAVVTFWNPTA